MKKNYTSIIALLTLCSCVTNHSELISEQPSEFLYLEMPSNTTLECWITNPITEKMHNEFNKNKVERYDALGPTKLTFFDKKYESEVYWIEDVECVYDQCPKYEHIRPIDGVTYQQELYPHCHGSFLCTQILIEDPEIEVFGVSINSDYDLFDESIVKEYPNIEIDKTDEGHIATLGNITFQFIYQKGLYIKADVGKYTGNDCYDGVIYD